MNMKVIIFMLCCTLALACETQVKNCWSSPIADKYKTEISGLQEKLRESYTDLNERQLKAQVELKQMLMNVKAENNKKIKNLIRIIGNSQAYRGRAYISTRNCAYQQNIEVTKIYNRNNALECSPNQNDVSTLYIIKANIVKLEKVSSVLINFCQYLNPLERESSYLNMCIASKIRHIHLQVHVIELEFKTQLTQVVNSVRRCLTEEGNNIERNLNLVASNLHKCNLA